MPDSDGCCMFCCRFIVTAGLAALFLWLSLRPSNPSCSIQFFYLPALNKTLNSTSNTSLAFMVELKNPNKGMGIRYDNVQLTFYGSPNKSSVVGNYTIAKFKQGHGKKAKKWGLMKTDGKAVPRAISQNGTAVFRLDLATEVRFRIVFWFTKRKKIMVWANVEVDEKGSKVKPKGIKLRKSSASKNGCYCRNILVGILMNIVGLLII